LKPEVVPDSLGARYLAELLGSPRRDVSAERLVGGGAAEPAQSILDVSAQRAYRHRVTELRADIDEADRYGDTDRASRYRLELDAVLGELERQVGSGGRPRAFTGPAERARTSVQKALRRTINAVSVDSPRLGDALRLSISTGRQCRFAPVEGLPELWDVSTQAVAAEPEWTS